MKRGDGTSLEGRCARRGVGDAAGAVRVGPPAVPTRQKSAVLARGACRCEARGRRQRRTGFHLGHELDQVARGRVITEGGDHLGKFPSDGAVGDNVDAHHETNRQDEPAESGPLFDEATAENAPGRVSGGRGEAG